MSTNGFDRLRDLLTADERRLLANEDETLRAIFQRLGGPSSSFASKARRSEWPAWRLVARAEQAKRNRETRISAREA